MVLAIALLATVGTTPLQAGAAGTATASPAVEAQGHPNGQSGQKTVCISPKAVQLGNTMRRLWSDHVTWTRNYIVSALAGLEDQQTTLNRLLQNQQDIGNAIKPYYGDAAGDKLAGLLREHILIAGRIVAAAKAGQTAEVEKLDKEWHRNGDEIVKFLHSANPDNWPYQQLKDMFDKHLELVTEALTTRLKKDWAGDVAAYDKGQAHLAMLADTLTEGIVKQFPQKFA
ncbi:glycosyltransferase [Paenibacillus cymbidii]|uniref:glycosyltransferase n=1 Tax=Paenibacillus cymbidii TaxID=1639034 RepID=UPI00108186FA